MPTQTLPQKKSTVRPVTKKAATPRAAKAGASTAKRPTKPDAKTTKSLLLEAAAQVHEGDHAKVVQEATAIEKKAASGGALDRFLDEIRMMIAMVGAYVSRRYREIPIGTMTAITGALLYVLSPLDFIPDFIPAMGLVDDAAVVSACLRMVGYDIRKFREWKRRHH